jgi:hypothetical protein
MQKTKTTIMMTKNTPGGTISEDIIKGGITSTTDTIKGILAIKKKITRKITENKIIKIH